GREPGWGSGNRSEGRIFEPAQSHQRPQPPAAPPLGGRAADDAEAPGLEARPLVEARPAVADIEVRRLQPFFRLLPIPPAATEGPAEAGGVESLQASFQGLAGHPGPAPGRRAA